MGNNIEIFKDKISRKELLVGTTISTNCPTNSEILGRCGFDFLWIDGEHSSMDNSDIDMHIMAACSAGCAPLVRVRWNDPAIVKPILDMGPAGIIFPLIKTADEARLAVSSCRYPPKGIRGFGPRRANEYSFTDSNKYLKLAAHEPMVILQVEHVEAVNNLDSILDVEGIDVIIVGPNDLAGSVGLLGQTSHPDVVELYEIIAGKCIKRGIPFGCATGTQDKQGLKDWMARGVSLITVEWDIGLLASGGRQSYTIVLETYNQFKIGK